MILRSEFRAGRDQRLGPRLEVRMKRTHRKRKRQRTWEQVRRKWSKLAKRDFLLNIEERPRNVRP